MTSIVLVFSGAKEIAKLMNKAEQQLFQRYPPWYPSFVLIVQKAL